MSAAAAPFAYPTRTEVVVASSSPEVQRRISQQAEHNTWSVVQASGGADALSKLEETSCRLLFVDDRLPDLNTAELIAMVESRYPGVEVVVVNPQTGLPTGSDSDIAESESTGSGKALPPSPKRADVEPLPNMVGSSTAMQKVYSHVRLVARRDTTVLVTGETGTGKELIAQAIHQLSPRAQGPLVAVNCAAIPETLLEAELFGYARGAFTGAVQSRIGKIHAAQNGTLFLDEIGEMDPGVQSKLLRFLENGEVQRLGSPDVFRVNVRVVAATNASLGAKVAAKQFRQDLFYRLAVFPISIPALRDRGEDLIELARHFTRQISNGTQSLSSDAEEVLRHHSWPGNIRELRHVIERACILAADSPVLTPDEIVILGDSE